jgi:hypothetical protein
MTSPTDPTSRPASVGPDAPTASGQRSTRAGDTLGGWAMFAAIVLLIVGTLNALLGLAAILNGDVLAVGGGEVIIWSFTAWGWIHFLVGLAMVLTGAGLLAMQEWARWAAVFFAALSAILQVGVITAFPLWSVLVIALDVVVIYQLTERWERGPEGRAVR